MSLRARLTVVVAGVVALTVAAGASAAWLATSNQLHGEVDRFLTDRVSGYVRTGPDDRELGGDRRDEHSVSLVDFDAITKVLDRSGAVYAAVQGQPALPVDATDKALAAAGSGQTRFRDVTVGGEHYRLLTVSLSGGGAVQLARSLAETDDILHALRDRLLLAALGGAGLAALVAWEVARRTTKPVAELTAAAEAVAATQDLSVPIPVRGDDEVGRLAASFNAMLAALGTSREQQKRLVADASHELRTPLTAVRTNVDLLLRADDLDLAQRRELLDETRLELDELTALVAELVELATDARAEEPVGPVDLVEVVEDVASRFRRRTGRVVTVTIDEPAEVEGRAAMLDRAVANLVDNALKFSPWSEPVEVEVHGGRITVLDRGPGVHGDDRTRVFDRFYRADATRTLPGSGLGLAIVSQVARVHGGRASIEPREGGGAIALLELPDRFFDSSHPGPTGVLPGGRKVAT
ncbi:MAG: mprB [Actinomycetia bacterium]|nr:mprB [Actinomycetes bacterium]